MNLIVEHSREEHDRRHDCLNEKCYPISEFFHISLSNYVEEHLESEHDND